MFKVIGCRMKLRMSVFKGKLGFGAVTDENRHRIVLQSVFSIAFLARFSTSSLLV